jgi:hypothetical protein
MFSIYLVQFYILCTVGVFQGYERLLKRVQPA